MTAEPTEPRRDGVSTLALDLYWAAGRTGDAALEAHVASCARCGAYLSMLDGIEARGPALAAEPPPAARALRRRAWLVPVAIALAASIALLVRGRAPEHDAYVGVKGTPAVQLLVHRDRETRPWDGHSPIRPGDALAVKVACEGMKRVAIAVPSGAEWTRLSNAACPENDGALPFTLQVDDAPGDERLAVVLSRDELDDAALQKAIAGGARGVNLWVVSFVMPKKTETNR